jgi:hypothetical protein
MRSRYIVGLLSLIGAGSLLFGCSQSGREAAELKSDVDKQKEIQKQVVDRRAEEIKENIAQKTKIGMKVLDSDKKQLDLEKVALDSRKDALKQYEDFADRNVDKQVTSIKKQIDRNADLAKLAVDRNHQK